MKLSRRENNRLETSLKRYNVLLCIIVTLAIISPSTTQAAETIDQATILSHSNYVDSTYWVFGEVENTGESTGIIEVSATFYDTTGTVIATDRQYTLITILGAGQKSPFILRARDIDANPIDPTSISNYEVKIETYSMTTEALLQQIKVLNERTYLDKEGYYHVSGEVKNNLTTPLQSPIVVASFYDVDNNIVEVGLVELTELAPAQPKEFDIKSLRNSTEELSVIDHYTVQALGKVGGVTITCSVSSNTVNFGETATVSGVISPPVTGEVIQIWVSSNGGSYTPLTNVTTVIDGGYTYSWTPPPGEYLIKSTLYSGGIQLETQPTSLMVNKATSIIEVQSLSEVTQTGDTVTVTGTTMPPIELEEITITLTGPDGVSHSETVTTGQDGSFQYTFTPDIAGAWIVQTNWLGDDLYTGAESTPITLTVNQINEVLRETPTPTAVALGVAAGTLLSTSLTYLMNMGGETLETLPVIGWIKDVVMDYINDLFDIVAGKKERKELGEKSLITREEIVKLAFAVTVIAFVFGYVEANGLPYFLEPATFLVAVSFVLCSSIVIIFSETIFNSIAARVFDVRAEINIWPIGLFSFLVSGLAFMVPFSMPHTTTFMSGEEASSRQGWIIVTSKLFRTALLLPFIAIHLLGNRMLGDAGVLIILTGTCYSLMPVEPMAGRTVYDFDKRIWFLLFAVNFTLFVTWSLKLLQLQVYIIAGFLSAAACGYALFRGKQLTKTGAAEP